MAPSEPHNIFLITELLELILLETDIRTLLTSAQRVCRKWYKLIKHSRDLQAALFFKPVRYTLPRGTPGIRNPLLGQCIWPWFCARQARSRRPPPVEGGAKIPQIDAQSDRRFLQKGVSWQKMLFQQPPRSCIGFVEKDGKVINGPAYTEVRVQPMKDHLRICDLVFPCCDFNITFYLHPLPEEGLIWHGHVPPEDEEPLPWYLQYPREIDQYGEIPRSQIAYATSTYLQDCDIVFFILECARIRGPPTSSRCLQLNVWLYHLYMSLVPGQTSVPMPVT